jgi:hypothetical protein
MMMELFYGFTAIFSAGVAMASAEAGGGYVEYGALGLCAFMVYFLCNHLTQKEKNHAEDRKETAKYLSRLALLLGDRPCLAHDRNRLNPDQNGNP